MADEIRIRHAQTFTAAAEETLRRIVAEGKTFGDLLPPSESLEVVIGGDPEGKLTALKVPADLADKIGEQTIFIVQKPSPYVEPVIGPPSPPTRTED